MPLPAKQTVLFGETSIPIIRSKRRTLSLEVTSNGVVARAPQRLAYKTIVAFINQKQNWIEKHLQNLPEPIPEFKYSDGATLKFLDHTISLRPKIGKRGKPQLIDHQLFLPVQKSNLPIEVSIKNKLNNWYKSEALTYLQTQSEYYAPQLDVTPNQVKVREYKRRWGSCDSKGKLTFNWRIIMAPQTVVDYVVIHELAHLREFNHSKRYWNIVEQQLAKQNMPDWRLSKQWLSDHGRSLYLICNKP